MDAADGARTEEARGLQERPYYGADQARWWGTRSEPTGSALITADGLAGRYEAETYGPIRGCNGF
jgi:hypothetical protein